MFDNPAVMLKIAAALAIGLMVLHSVLGEKYILVRLFKRDNLPKLFGDDRFTKGTLRFCWHIMSVFGAGLGVVLWILSNAPQGGYTAAITQVVGGVFAVCALLAFAFTRGRHLSWVVFGAISVLVFVSIVWTGPA